MGEDGPGKVGGVLTLLEVEVELSVIPDRDPSAFNGSRVWESLPCAWSGRTQTGALDDEAP